MFSARTILSGYYPIELKTSGISYSEYDMDPKKNISHFISSLFICTLENLTSLSVWKYFQFLIQIFKLISTEIYINGIQKTDFQIKMKTGLVLFLMFFVTVFSISAEQQAAIDRLKVKQLTNKTFL